MTLLQVINELKAIGMRQPTVRTAGEGSIYTFMNGNGKQRYCVFFITQTTHRQDDTFDYYGFNLFYVDRLDSTLEENRVQVQSIAKDVLSNIIKTFCEYFDADVQTLVFHPFTEKFTDLTAGMYVTVEFQIPLDYICLEEF